MRKGMQSSFPRPGPQGTITGLPPADTCEEEVNRSVPPLYRSTQSYGSLTWCQVRSRLPWLQQNIDAIEQLIRTRAQQFGVEEGGRIQNYTIDWRGDDNYVRRQLALFSLTNGGKFQVLANPAASAPLAQPAVSATAKQPSGLQPYTLTSFGGGSTNGPQQLVSAAAKQPAGLQPYTLTTFGGGNGPLPAAPASAKQPSGLQPFSASFDQQRF